MSATTNADAEAATALRHSVRVETATTSSSSSFEVSAAHKPAQRLLCEPLAVAQLRRVVVEDDAARNPHETVIQPPAKPALGNPLRESIPRGRPPHCCSPQSWLAGSFGFRCRRSATQRVLPPGQRRHRSLLWDRRADPGPTGSHAGHPRARPGGRRRTRSGGRRSLWTAPPAVLDRADPGQADDDAWTRAGPVAARTGARRAQDAAAHAHDRRVGLSSAMLAEQGRRADSRRRVVLVRADPGGQRLAGAARRRQDGLHLRGGAGSIRRGGGHHARDHGDRARHPRARRQVARLRAEAADLDGYRRALTRALAQVRDSLASAERALERIGEDERAKDGRAAPFRGRLLERGAVLDVLDNRAAAVEDLVRARVAELAWLRDAGVSVEVRVEPGVALGDPRAPALLGATVTGALTNVARARRATHARVSCALAGGRMRLYVHDNGGVDGAPSGAISMGRGMENLRRQARVVGGELSVTAEPDGVLCRLELPLDIAAPVTEDVAAVEMLKAIDGRLKLAVRICAVMVVAMALRSEQLVERSRRRGQVLSLLAVAAYEALELAGALDVVRRRAQLSRATAPEQWLLAASGVASAVSLHREHLDAVRLGERSPGSPWPCRPAARAPRAHGAPCRGDPLSYRGSRRAFAQMAAHQVGTCACGPVLVALVVMPPSTGWRGVIKRFSTTSATSSNCTGSPRTSTEHIHVPHRWSNWHP